MTGAHALRRSTILTHGSVGLPLAMIGYPVAIYLPPLYAEEMGLQLSLIGLVLFLARASDVVTDPLIGSLSDRFRTPWGRRKPWMLAGTPVMLVGIAYLFMPEPPVGVGYLLGWSAVMYLGWTMITLPYGAWGAELSGDYHQRSRVTGAREGYILVGLFVAALVPAVVQHLAAQGRLPEGNAPILAAMAYVTMVTLPVAVAVTLWRIPEPPPEAQESLPWRRGLRLMWRNGPLKRMLIILMIVITGEAFSSALSVFFMKHAVGIPDRVGLMYLLYFGTGILAIPFWLRLGRRVGKHRALAAAMALVSAVSFPMVFLQTGALAAFAVLFTMKGFCFGAFQFLPLAMLADIVDLDTARSGSQRTGLFFATAGMVQKAAMALGTGLSLNLVELAGFRASGEHTGAGLLALKINYVLMPILFFAAAMLLTWRYPLTETRQARLRRRIAARDARLGMTPSVEIEP